MADSKISADYSVNPFTWDGTEILPGIKAGANGAGLVSALQTYFATLKTAQNEAPPVTLGSSSSVAIGAAASNTITITGTNTITGFDTIGAGAKRVVTFSGILTLTHNATSFILPSAANITTAVGDAAEFISLGSGNWRCVQYQRANGTAIVGSAFTGGTLASALNEAPPVTIASAASVAIGAAAANTINITGTATITSFDTVAAGALRCVIFGGALTLTYNATSLILPGGASITTAAGDSAFFESLGSGNWQCVGYQRASGASLVGGGGLTNFSESISTAVPNNTIPTVQLVANNAATNVDVVLTPKGTGSLLAQIPTNTTAGGNKRGLNAVDWQTVRSNPAQVASGNNATIGGGGLNTASGNQSTVAGGESNTANSLYAAVGGGSGNTAGSRCAIAGGVTNTASGLYSAIAGGISNTTGGAYAFAAGNTNTVSGQGAFALGESNTADALDSGAIGANATTRTLMGAFARANGQRSALGDNQVRSVVLRAQTTTTTGVVATSNAGAAGTTNQLGIPTGSVTKFRAQIALRNTATDAAGWFDVSGAMKNAAGTVLIIGTTSVSAYQGDAALNASTVTVSADNTNKCVQFTVAGIAATTINWAVDLVALELQ